MSRCLLAVVLLGIVSTAFPDPGQRTLIGADAPAMAGLRTQLRGTWRLVKPVHASTSSARTERPQRL